MPSSNKINVPARTFLMNDLTRKAWTDRALIDEVVYTAKRMNE